MESTDPTDTPLKRWRTAEKITAQEAADRVGVSLPTWSRWESDKREVPAVRVLDVERTTGISRHDLRPDIFGPATEASAA